jgi:hypothetical protein
MPFPGLVTCANRNCHVYVMTTEGIPVGKVSRVKRKRGYYCIACATMLGWKPPQPKVPRPEPEQLTLFESASLQSNPG